MEQGNDSKGGEKNTRAAGVAQGPSLRTRANHRESREIRSLNHTVAVSNEPLY